MSAPVDDRTDTPTRASGVTVDCVGALVRLTLPCGATAMLTHDQALELSAGLNRGHNVVVSTKPGGAS